MILQTYLIYFTHLK